MYGIWYHGGDAQHQGDDAQHQGGDTQHQGDRGYYENIKVVDVTMVMDDTEVEEVTIVEDDTMVKVFWDQIASDLLVNKILLPDKSNSGVVRDVLQRLHDSNVCYKFHKIDLL